MKVGGMLRDTVVASVVLAAVTAIGAVLLNQPSTGIGIAIGLILGSGNGFLIVRLFDPQSSFVGSSLARLAVFSVLALAMALMIGSAAWTVLIGVAAAQLVMVAAGVREGLRAK